MTKKFLILGCGRVGSRLAQLLEAEGYSVTVIDREPASFSRLEKFKGTRLLGNGIDVDILRKGEIESSYGFAAVTNGDNTNLMTAQVAQKIFNVPKVVCRVYDPKRAGIYSDFGIQTVCSTTAGARMIRNLLSDPILLRSYHLGGGTAQAIEVKIGEAAVGKTIAEIEIPGKFLVSAVVRRQAVLIPEKTEVLMESDQVFGVVLADSLEEVRNRLGIARPSVKSESYVS